MYIKTHSKERVQELCDMVGTKPTWFSLCARGHGEFSFKMAIDLEAASRVLAELEGDYMTVDEIYNTSEQVKDRVEYFKQQIIEKTKAA